jgi:hypothetical protein
LARSGNQVVASKYDWKIIAPKLEAALLRAIEVQAPSK